MSLPRTHTADWQNLAGSFVFELPSADISQFVSRSGDVVIAMAEEGGGYHLGDRSNGYRGFFTDFAAVDRYARTRAEEILAGRSVAMVAETGLDPDQWVFRNSDRFVFFESVGRPKVRLERHGSTRWAVVLEGITVGFAPTPQKAYELLRR